MKKYDIGLFTQWRLQGQNRLASAGWDYVTRLRTAQVLSVGGKSPRLMGFQYGVVFPWDMTLDQAGICPDQEKEGFGDRFVCARGQLSPFLYRAVCLVMAYDGVNWRNLHIMYVYVFVQFLLFIPRFVRTMQSRCYTSNPERRRNFQGCTPQRHTYMYVSLERMCTPKLTTLAASSGVGYWCHAKLIITASTM